MFVLLKEVKSHLNLDSDFNEDDQYIIDLIKVCEDVVSKRMGKKLSECLTKEGDLIPSVKHSILVLIGTYYSQRESTSPSTITEVPYTFDFLCDLEKRYSM